MGPSAISKHLDHLSYLDDYMDTIEALPLELQRNFTLMRELDGYAQDIMETVATHAIDLIDNIKDMDAPSRFEKLKRLDLVLTETLKRSEEKVALAKSTFDAVDRHCNRLDANLVKLEEDHPVGRIRITSYPGLEPSARHLRLGFRGNALKRLDGKDIKGDKKTKKRRLKDRSPPPPGGVARSAQAQKAQDKIKPFAPGSKSTKKTTTSASSKNVNIDPNEPLYCYCQQVSFGEMVACDNADCDIEWFHLACVDLKTVPKGKWYCDNCTGKSKGKQRR